MIWLHCSHFMATPSSYPSESFPYYIGLQFEANLADSSFCHSHHDISFTD